MSTIALLVAGYIAGLYIPPATIGNAIVGAYRWLRDRR